MRNKLKIITKNEGNQEISIENISYLSEINFKKIKIIDNNSIIKTLKRYFINCKLLISLLFFLTYLLYFLSLEKCYLGIDDCPTKIKWIMLKIFELIISCIILSILIEFLFYNLISKLNIIHIIIIFVLFYKYSHGLDFDNHGFFNFAAYFALLVVFLIIFIPFNLLIYMIKRKSKISIILYTVFISLSIMLFIFIFKTNIIDCNDWPKGLNNSFIQNNSSKYGCQITFPKKCPYKIFSIFQDYTKILGINCEKYKIYGGKEKLLSRSKSSFVNKKANRIGYPLTNVDPSCYLDLIEGHNYVEEYFFNNLVDMDNKNILDKYFKDKLPEVIVDFTNVTKPKLIIKLNYNKTLSEERILLEKINNPYSKNIMILYIDSVSRANSVRKLKKTTKFFEKFMPFEGGFNKKYPFENFHSFQFFKYHSFRFHTSYNYPILFSGQPKLSNKVLITKYLKENGYITGYSGDYCYRDNIRLHNNATLNEIYDHQFLICDPNINHYNSYTLNCLYGKPNSQHLYEYGLQFWRKYKNNRKFLTIISNDGHEGTLEVLKYLDDIIYNFLNELFNDNLLKDSTIFLLSDHGVGMPSIYYLNDFFWIEENLPMLYILVNDRKNLDYEKQYKYIFENQQTFITGFDIYNTIGNIIYGDNYHLIKNKTLENDTTKSGYGKSLFEQINPKNRNPQKYQFSTGIKSEYCK